MMDDIDLTVGSLRAVRFRGLNATSLSALEKIYGKQSLVAAETSIRPISMVHFESVAVPLRARYVGSNACYDEGICYVRDEQSWACFSLDQLWSENVEYKFLSHRAFNIYRLMRYYVEPVVRSRAILHDQIFMHSASVVLDQGACVFSGWKGSGKTSLMLEFLCQGATVLSDDWSVWLSNGKLAGYPRTISPDRRLLNLFPELRARVSRTEVLALTVAAAFERLSRQVRSHQASWLHLREVLENALNELCVAHLRITEETPHKEYPVRAVFDVQNVGPGRTPRVRQQNESDFVERAAMNFLSESKSLKDCLSEWQFTSRQARYTEKNLQPFYTTALWCKLRSAPPFGLFSLELPRHGTRATLSEAGSAVRQALG